MNLEDPMANEESLAADTLDRLAVQLTGIQEASKQLKALGSYKDAIAKLQADHQAVTEQLTTASILHNQAKQDFEQAKRDADLTRTQATTDAKSIRESARADAAKMIEEAKAKVSAELDRQAALRKDDKSKLEAEISAASQKLDALQASIVRATQAEAEATEKATKAQANLDKIKSAAKALAT